MSRFDNILVALGDSLTWMGPGYKPEGDNWVSVLEFGLSGYGHTTIAAASGNRITVAPDTGAFFRAGTRFRLVPAGMAATPLRFTGQQGTHDVTVMAREADVLTVSPAPWADLAIGTQMVGTGGGAAMVGASCGHSGDTTAQILAKLPAAFEYGTPSMALILGGTNDANPQGSTAIVANPPPDGAGFGVAPGTAAALATAGSWLRIGEADGVLVTAVEGDRITCTGLAAAPAPGARVSIDTVRNLVAIGQALQDGGVMRIMMLGAPGCNFTKSGDWPTIRPGTQALLGKQRAAATTLGVKFCSLYDFMSARIAAHIDGAASETYQIAPGNVHPGAYGDRVYAMAVATAMVTAGWLNG